MKLKAQLNLLGKVFMFLIPYTHYHILPLDYDDIDERTLIEELISLHA